MMSQTYAILFLLAATVTVTIVLEDAVPIHAESPSYTRQEVKDVNGSDWTKLIRGIPEYLEENAPGAIKFPDIASVTYSSDGKVLNSTTWLSSEFEKIPNGHEPFYLMYIDVDSDNKTGLEGGDYAIGIRWNGTSHTWSKVFLEFSSVQTDKILREERVNYTDFTDQDLNSVSMSVDLNQLYNPAQYNLAFTLQDVFNGTQIYDSTSWLPAPPPQFNMSLSDPSLVLRPGDEKDIELSIQSVTNLHPRAFFAVANPKDATVEINPNNVTLSGSQKFASQIHVKVLPNASNQVHTIPIVSHIVFPLERQNLLGLHIHRYSYLTLDVLPNLQFLDYFNSGLNMLGSPIKQLLEIVTTIFAIAGIGGIATWKLIKVKQKKKKTDGMKR